MKEHGLCKLPSDAPPPALGLPREIPDRNHECSGPGCIDLAMQQERQVVFPVEVMLVIDQDL